ncbi:uncharacterized protein LOC143296733 [Babylonia areolata]|uniref:uncharacterized protein LOC143296733 n=1 Tax=Babylonia areolata TaxID=304850 RepID=UPI003FD41D54
MSFDEKMQTIDRELRRLQAESLKSGYSATQVEKFASCFFEAARKAQREKWVKIMIGVAVMGLLCYVVLQFKSPYGLLVFLARTAQIKTLSVWDWTEVYQSNCLLTNPLYSPPNDLTLQHCQMCEGVESVEHVQNVSGQELVERYIQRDLPVLVHHGLHDWPDVTVRTARHLAELYERTEVLKRSAGCGFSSNLASQYGGHRALLHALLTRNISHYYAHWENCEGRAGKMLRTVFRRPDFLPPALQMTSSSWLFLSHHYSASIFKQVDVRQPLLMLVQVSGRTELKLQAWRPCYDLCPVLHLTLHAGQALLATEFLWKASYLPSPDGESLAVGLGFSF